MLSRSIPCARLPMHHLTNWFKANRLALNVNKSNCMLFQPNGNQNTLGHTLNIGVDPI